MLNPYPDPQLKGYVLSHNSRNTNKLTFEISPKSCRPRTSRKANILSALAISPSATLESPGASRFQTAWQGTCTARCQAPQSPLTSKYRLAGPPLLQDLTMIVAIAWRPISIARRCTSTTICTGLGTPELIAHSNYAPNTRNELYQVN